MSSLLTSPEVGQMFKTNTTASKMMAMTVTCNRYIKVIQVESY